MEQYRFKYLSLLCLALLFLCFLPSAGAFNAYTDKITYAYNDTISIAGIVESSSAVNVTAALYNASGELMNSSNVTSTGTSTNTFTITNKINGSYAAGSYYAVVTDGTDAVNVSFGVVPELLMLEAHLMNSSTLIPVDTSSLVTGDTDYSGNFTELRLLSLNTGKVLHYGNATVNGTLYHFVLADPNYAGVYDTLYIDDDKDFRLYNDTEDGVGETEKLRKSREKFKGYVIGEIDFATGNLVLLGIPLEDSVYNAGEQVYFVVIIKNSSYNIKSDQAIDINVTLADKSNTVMSSVFNTTSTGYFVSNLSAPATPGFYTIKLNNTPAEVFTVETFMMYGSVSDQAGNPMYSFAPNPVVRITATVKTAGGDAINGATVSAVITYPNGTARSVTLSGGNGTYYNDVDMVNAPVGGYNVKISATYSSNTQEFQTGFQIEVISLYVMAINPQFMEEAEGPEATVDAFAPSGTISLMVLLSNISTGGFGASGPEGEGTIDIDNASTTNDECNTSVQLVSVKDDRDVSLNLSLLNVSIMNLTNAMGIIMGGGAPLGEGPPESMLRQCMVIFNNISRSGSYKAEIKLKHPLGEKASGTKFNIQRLYATANPVDFKGDDFWFYAPNTTIRIKLKVLDLATRQELPASNITDAKITDMFKEWPSYQDVFNSDYRAVANESVANGTISFTSPNAEGFFSMRFKFRASVAGSTEEGSGSGFFMLKKYMIWGELAGCSQGQPCMKGVGENVTLTVHVIDVSKGSLLDMGQSQGLTCTDCDGLEVDVNEMFNGQLMKRMTSGTDYSVVKGAVNASSGSAVMNITPLGGNMPSGWYNLDLILRDPANSNNTYFGWAGFEVRNFWVDIMPVYDDGENLSASWGKATVGIGQPAVFAVAAWNPSGGGEFGPQPLAISSISLQGISRVSKSGGPPVPLQDGTDYSYSPSFRNVTVQTGGQGGQTVLMWVVNITGLTTASDYQANIRATTSSGSDVGSGWFSVSSYIADVVYRGMEQWPATFAPTENLTINITGLNFYDSPHNLSATGTKIRSFWNQKTGNPIKVNSSTTCIVNFCNITMNLSQVGAGRFDISLSINDTSGNSKEDGLSIEVKSMSVVTPSIKEVWVDMMTDTVDRELDVRNDRDRCKNEKYLQWDQNSMMGDVFKGLNDEASYSMVLQNDTCPLDTSNVCITNYFGGLSINFTFEAGQPNGTVYAGALCLLNNGSIDIHEDNSYANINASCSGRLVYAVGNTTYLWFNISGVAPASVGNRINMTGIAAKAFGSTFNTGGPRNWTVNTTLSSCGGPENSCFRFKDDKLVRMCSGPDCTEFAVPAKNTALTYTTAIYCVNATGWPNSVTLPCSGGTDQVNMVSNGTNMWMSTSWLLNNTSPLTEGQSLAAAFTSGSQWTLLDLAKDWDGTQNNNTFRVVMNYTYYLVNANAMNINVSRKYSKNFGGMFCIRSSGEWNDAMGSCQGNDTAVYVISNTTHLWVSGTASVTGSQARAAGQTFDAAGKTWTVANASNPNNPQAIVVNNSVGICGEMDNPNCQGPCQSLNYTATPPALHTSYSTVYHGYVTNLVQEQGLAGWFGQAFNYTRPVYIYHNTTHVWMNNTPLFAGAGTPVGQIINDSYGGRWTVKTISKNKVTLSGINVLAKTGAWFNTSLSRSGYVKIAPVREDELGGWDKVQGTQVGLDLNGDGATNSTIYFAVSDNASTGVYDMFFFSNSSNMLGVSSAIPLTASMATRTFGIGANLTLLSISPDGKKVKVYGNRSGDWGEMGEQKVGTIVRVPVLVLSPSGAYTTANVSIKNLRKEPGDAPMQFVTLSTPYPNATCTGLCEISINLSAVTPPQPQSGKYSFEITATKDGQEERMDEWRWPFITLRAFLNDLSVGEGGYASNFARLPLTRYDWESYGNMIPDVYSQTINEIGRTFYGVFSNSRGDQANLCSNYQRPSTVESTTSNWTLKMNDMLDYWMYINAGNATKVWIKSGNCNFTGNATMYSTGNQTNVTMFNRTYMLYVLDVNTTANSQGVVIGVPNLDYTIIRPLRNDSGQLSWKLMGLNISNTLYDVILGNDSIDYPMCSIWNMPDCAKRAWFDTDGNFSAGAVGNYIGQNFTSQLYLARVGAGPWEGVIISNFSQIIPLVGLSLPAIDVRPKDSTTSWFGVFNEATINLDLNKDSDKNDTFYAVTFDEREDGQQALTDIVTDDDMSITEEWWNDPNANSSLLSYYKDFYGNESGEIREYRRSLPRGSEYGSVAFGASSGLPQELSPEWDVATYNGSDMLLRKWKWQFLNTDNITVMARVYGFDQAAIAGANVSVEKLMSFGPFGATVLTAPSNYTASSALTNAYGWAVLRLQSSGSWQFGEYMVQLRIESSGKVERSYNWFRVSPGGP